MRNSKFNKLFNIIMEDVQDNNIEPIIEPIISQQKSRLEDSVYWNTKLGFSGTIEKSENNVLMNLTMKQIYEIIVPEMKENLRSRINKHSQSLDRNNQLLYQQKLYRDSLLNNEYKSCPICKFELFQDPEKIKNINDLNNFDSTNFCKFNIARLHDKTRYEGQANSKTSTYEHIDKYIKNKIEASLNMDVSFNVAKLKESIRLEKCNYTKKQRERMLDKFVEDYINKKIQDDHSLVKAMLIELILDYCSNGFKPAEETPLCNINRNDTIINRPGCNERTCLQKYCDWITAVINKFKKDNTLDTYIVEFYRKFIYPFRDIFVQSLGSNIEKIFNYRLTNRYVSGDFRNIK